MSITSHRTGRVLAGLAATAAATTGLAVATAPAQAATSTKVFITKVSPLRLPALTANQTITITGTGFSEDSISSVAIAGCTAGNYIVTSPTTILFKTDATCTTSAGVITITDSASAGTAVASGATQVPVFVSAPSLASLSTSVHSITTDATDGLLYANQVASASTTGGSTIRVTAGSVKFVNSPAFPLKATLGGVALTNIVLGSNGDYFTGVVGAHAADSAPVLSVTSNGVSKSFAAATATGTAAADKHDFAYAGTAITATPSSGPVKGGTVLKVSGSGFDPATTVVKVGTATCPKAATPVSTATAYYCTVPAVTAAGPLTVTATTGSVASVVGAGSTFTYLAQ